MSADTRPLPSGEEVYLGDGVYASCDGFQICLRAPRWSSALDHRIYLEPGVLRALLREARQWMVCPEIKNEWPIINRIDAALKER